MDFIPVVIALVLGAGAGMGGFYAYNKHNEKGGKDKADELIRKAKHEASEIVLNAKKEAADTTSRAQREENERRKERVSSTFRPFLHFQIVFVPYEHVPDVGDRKRDRKSKERPDD